MTVDFEEREKLRLDVAQYLGWTLIEFNRAGFLVGRVPGKKIIRPVPSYVQDIAAAWEIVEFLAFHGIFCQIENRVVAGPLRNYFVEIGNERDPRAKANHVLASVAICLAFRGFWKDRVIQAGDYT